METSYRITLKGNTSMHSNPYNLVAQTKTNFQSISILGQQSMCSKVLQIIKSMPLPKDKSSILGTIHASTM